MMRCNVSYVFCFLFFFYCYFIGGMLVEGVYTLCEEMVWIGRSGGDGG